LLAEMLKIIATTAWQRLSTALPANEKHYMLIFDLDSGISVLPAGSVMNALAPHLQGPGWRTRPPR